MKRKVYIAGKITGDPNYKDKFAKAEAALKKNGFIVMNPAILPEGFEWEEYMCVTLAMLRVCNYICPLDDWAQSKGASIEMNTANARGYGIVNTEGIVISDIKPHYFNTPLIPPMNV